MDQDLIGKRPSFHRDHPRPNSYRILLWLALILGAIWLMLQVQSGAIKPLFVPTVTPTRMARSYLLEADAYFKAGKIDDPNTSNDAIDTYRTALEQDPDDAQAWSELARILTYSSSLLPTQESILARRQEALAAIDQAVELEPDDSAIHAVRAFVLDWLASGNLVTGEQRQDYLTEAEGEAVRALQLDPNNALALAFYAEVLLDEQKWSQAEQYAEQATKLDPNSMDAHRVYATVLESLGAYRLAIEQYDAAARITPNLTFLYISIGVNYRHLQVFEKALEYFDRATNINEQIGVKDPLPYIAIAKTYSQMGEFFVAARNAEKALSLDPTEANTYGQLGIIYVKSRNYESAMPALKCAVESCTASDNLVLQRLSEENPDWGVEPVAVRGLPLDSIEIAYYYAIYGQVLAYLSRPRENYCPQAIPVLDKVRIAYSNDEVLMEIVEGSQAICSQLEGSASP